MAGVITRGFGFQGGTGSSSRISIDIKSEIIDIFFTIEKIDVPFNQQIEFIEFDTKKDDEFVLFDFEKVYDLPFEIETIDTSFEISCL